MVPATGTASAAETVYHRYRYVGCRVGFLTIPLCYAINSPRCVFGEMFKGKPILAGSSDLNQAQLIFNLVGSPTEENMPGWSALPGCEGVRAFGYRPGNLHEIFKEYGPLPQPEDQKWSGG